MRRIMGRGTLMLTLALAGCQPASNDAGRDASAAEPAPPTAPVSTTSREPDEVKPVDDPTTIVATASGIGWRYRTEYPDAVDAMPALRAHLRTWLADQRTGFMESVDAASDLLAEQPDRTRYRMETTWRIGFENAALLSLIASGSIDTGGAHPQPIVEVLHYDRANDRMLDPATLTASPAALEALALRIRAGLTASLDARLAALPGKDRSDAGATLATMINDGTGPEAANFARFVPERSDATVSGLRFLFPAYQVAPYSDGLQEVTVPLAELAPWLGPEWARVLTQ